MKMLIMCLLAIFTMVDGVQAQNAQEVEYLGLAVVDTSYYATGPFAGWPILDYVAPGEQHVVTFLGREKGRPLSQQPMTFGHFEPGIDSLVQQPRFLVLGDTVKVFDVKTQERVCLTYAGSLSRIGRP